MIKNMIHDSTNGAVLHRFGFSVLNSGTALPILDKHINTNQTIYRITEGNLGGLKKNDRINADSERYGRNDWRPYPYHPLGWSASEIDDSDNVPLFRLGQGMGQAQHGRDGHYGLRQTKAWNLNLKNHVRPHHPTGMANLFLFQDGRDAN